MRVSTTHAVRKSASFAAILSGLPWARSLGTNAVTGRVSAQIPEANLDDYLTAIRPVQADGAGEESRVVYLHFQPETEDFAASPIRELRNWDAEGFLTNPDEAFAADKPCPTCHCRRFLVREPQFEDQPQLNYALGVTPEGVVLAQSAVASVLDAHGVTTRALPDVDDVLVVVPESIDLVVDGGPLSGEDYCEACGTWSSINRNQEVIPHGDWLLSRVLPPLRVRAPSTGHLWSAWLPNGPTHGVPLGVVSTGDGETVLFTSAALLAALEAAGASLGEVFTVEVP